MTPFKINIVNSRGDDENVHLKLVAAFVKNEENGSLFNVRDGGALIPCNIDGIEPFQSTSFQAFKEKQNDQTLSIDTIEGARLYIAQGEMKAGESNPREEPAPDKCQYYGWIEFSKMPNDEGLWINLSNVDMLGLPLALEGKLLHGKEPFKLGYKKSVVKILDDLKQHISGDDVHDCSTGEPKLTDPQPASQAFSDEQFLALKAPGQAPASASSSSCFDASTTPINNNTLIKCSTGQVKAVGPNVTPGRYQSYEGENGYLTRLAKARASLIISTDFLKGDMVDKTIVFRGTFLDAKNDDDIIIRLQDEDRNTFIVRKGQFNTEIIYRCDGGCLEYNGETLPQNRTRETDPAHFDANDPDGTFNKFTITNSVFRNICIGINEGYFTTDGENRSTNFPYLTPFAKGDGSDYARVLFENSNSYGFPYADSNLKVLIQAHLDEPVTLHILHDDLTDEEAAFFTNPENSVSENTPNSGQYFLQTGTGCDLGMIKIGNCKYLPNTAGAYTGYLPTLNTWEKMIFNAEKAGDQEQFVWIKTPEQSDQVTIMGNELLDGVLDWEVSDEPKFVKKLKGGANIKWGGGTPPPKPADSDSPEEIQKQPLKPLFFNK